MKILGTTRSLWAISLPLIFAGISESVVDITDTIFLAHYGETELGAIAIADAMYELLIVLTIGVVEGLQIVISRRAGQENHEGIGSAFQQGLYLLGISSLLVFVILRVGSPALTGVLVGSEDVRDAVDAFLAIIAFNAFFDAMNFAYGAFYVGIGRTRILVTATIVLTVTNVALDYLLIFGELGLPELGIEGAAIASLSAEVAALIFVTYHTWRRGYMQRFKLFGWRPWDSALARRLMGLSSPVALDALVGAAQWFLFFVFVERLGEPALAASAIVYTCHVVLWIPLEGLSEATATSSGNLIGQGFTARIAALVRSATAQSYLLVVPVVGFTMLFPELVLAVFTSEAEEISGSVSSLRIVGLALLIAVPGEIFMGAISGSGDTRAVFAIELVVTILVLAYTWLAVMVFAWSLPVIWLSLALGWALRLILSALHLRGGTWKDIDV